MPRARFAACGSAFVPGPGVGLRPGALLAPLIFTPTFPAVSVLREVAARAAFPPAEARNLPILASGALAGFKRRRRTRGGP